MRWPAFSSFRDFDSVTFHWENGRSGVKKIQALLGLEPIHRGRDLLREHLAVTGVKPASAEVLVSTYSPRENFKRRFDSIWATPEFQLHDLQTYDEEAVAAGSDHALIAAELELSPRISGAVGGRPAR